MFRISILVMTLLAPLWGQRDVRYYFNGKERVQLEEAPPNTVHAWRIRAGSRILQKVRQFESHMSVFRTVGTNSDALALLRNRAVPTATELFFNVLVKSGQAQKLRVFRRVGKTAPLIEYPEIYLKLKPGVTAAALRQALLKKKYLPGNIEEALHGWAFLDVEVPSETLALADDLNHMP